MTLPNPESNSPLLCKNTPWQNNTNVIWLGSTITLHRNMEKFEFPSKLSTDRKQQLLSLFGQEILKSPSLKKPQLIHAEKMSPIEKEFLMEHFLTMTSFHQMHIGEAVILDETGEFLATLNVNDHLMLTKIDYKEELEATWDQVVKIETTLSSSINFAFSPPFGFLTADPTKCGTGLSVNIFLHLPALLQSNRLEEIIKKNKEEGIGQTGLQGNPEEIIGDILVLHNNYTLGLTEENILSSLRTLATKLIVEEKSIRSQLKQEQKVETSLLKDKVSRAYGLIMYSYQIEVIEAIEALSLLKLGLDLQWLNGVEQSVLNTLLFTCRRAHLICQYGQTITQEELSHKRAAFIHQKLKGLTLLV